MTKPNPTKARRQVRKMILLRTREGMAFRQAEKRSRASAEIPAACGLRRDGWLGMLAAVMNLGFCNSWRGCLLGAAVLLSAGCAGREASPPDTVTMEVLSLPRGCIVEMNGEYLGATPVKIDIPATPEGRWRGAPEFRHVIAVSTPNNRAVETRKWRTGDQIPRRVLFRPPYAQFTGATP
jgi:hypothetical protein